MRHIMLINPKGGCGKSTLATNLASYYASEGYRVVLVDYDSQASSVDWVKRRPKHLAPITAVEGYLYGLRYMPRNADFVILDAPARCQGPELTDLVNHADTIIVPVLPSSIDMQAAGKFIGELKSKGRVAGRRAKVAVVANRVKENTLIFDELDQYLGKLRVPYVAALREAQNYIRAYARGLGIYELPEYLAWPDWEQWDPLIEYLDSRRSKPVA